MKSTHEVNQGKEEKSKGFGWARGPTKSKEEPQESLRLSNSLTIVPSPLFLLLLHTISRFVLATLISTIVVFTAKTRLWEYIRRKAGSIFSISLEYQLNFGRRQITLRVPINEDLRRLLEIGETQTTIPLPNSATRTTPSPQQEEGYPPSPSSQGSRTAVDPTERQECDVLVMSSQLQLAVKTFLSSSSLPTVTSLWCPRSYS